MREIPDRPPNFDRILTVLPGAEHPGVIFAYAPDIYVPSGIPLPPELVAHEEVHIKQQVDVGGPEAWWDRYLVDPKFRLEQEVPAHVAEYRHIIKDVSDREVRSRKLHRVALKLCAPLYGYNLTYSDAQRLLR